MSLYRLLLRSLRRSTTAPQSLTSLTLQNPISSHPHHLTTTRYFAYSTAEEAAAERRRRKRRLRIEPPLHALRRDSGPPPPRDPNAPRLPDSTSALVGPRLNLHNRVQSLIRAGDLDAASAVARHSVFSNTRPTVFTCNAIIAAMYRGKRYNDAIALFHFFFNQSNIVPNIVSYNNLINTHCDEGRVDVGLEIYRHIIATAPFSPSPVTYRHLTKGLIDAGRIGDAVDLLREMLNKGHGADSLVFNNLIKGFLDLENLDKANELFDELKERCLVYDGVVNATFMDWFFNKGQEKEAMDSYRSLLDRQFRMIPATCNVLLEVLLKHDKKKEAWALFEQMLDNHTPPNFQAVNSETFNIMVSECFKLGKFAEAFDTFKKVGTNVKSKPFSMDVAGYNNIIARYCENGMLSEADALFTELSSKSLTPDVTTHRTLIDAYLNVERIDDALKIFNRMVDVGLRVVATFGNRVFTELIKNGKAGECAKILKKMGEKDPKPDASCYDVVIRGLCTEGELDSSLDLLAEMVRYGIGIPPALKQFAYEAFEKVGRGGQARNFRFQCGLVYVAEPGYMLFRAGVPRHAMIKKFAGQEISRLDDLISVLCKLSRGARVPLEYVSYADRHRRKSVLVTMDRHAWYAPPQLYTRDDSTGLWTMKPAFQPDASLLPSGIYNLDGRSLAVPLCTEASSFGHMHHDSHAESNEGITSMEISYEYYSDGGHPRDASDVETKKRRVKEDFSSDPNVLADGSFLERNEGVLEDANTVENSMMRNFQGENLAAVNSSLAERIIEPTLVMLEVHVPPLCMLDGVHSQHFFGTGVIIYHSQNMGLIAVDKNTVAISASDVMLSFAAFPIEIPGEVVFLHPVHNYALISYDPLALGAVGISLVRAAELLPEPAIRRGDSVHLVGLSRSLQATSRKSIVTNPCAAVNISSADCPRYRATNMEVIELDTDFGSTFSGVLTDEHGRVRAIWGSFSTQLKFGCSSSEDHQFVRGIPIYTISEVLGQIISGAQGPPLLINSVKRPMPLVRILEVELYPTLLSKARSFGLSDDWVQALVKKDPIRRQVLRVKGCLAGSKAENLLEQGDMVLAINKEPVTCFRDVENACQALGINENKDGKLSMTIFRQGRELDVLVGTDIRDGSGTTRVINWCGCIVQDPHPAVRALGFLPEEGHGVYVARWCHGSPAHRYGLYALQWIVEVNGKKTPDLDAFLNVTKEIEHGEFVCLRTVHLNGKPEVPTLKQDLHYWPTWEVRFDPDSAIWRRHTIKALDYKL